MIIQCNLRGSSKQLGNHLLNEKDNDHIEILRVEHCATESPIEALREMYAISKATKAKKFLASIVLSPPYGAELSQKKIFDAADRAMKKVGLKNQPNIIIAHEKNGKRHYHLVVSRIDTEHMKAIKMPYYKLRLNALSHDLFIEHNLALPDGFKIGYKASPTNFTLKEWQQSQRLGKHPKQLKQAIKQSWDITDTRTSFETALRESGCLLARGDRRNVFVAVSWQGEVIPLNKKNLGATAKAIRSKLGQPETAKSIQEIKATIAVEHYGLHKKLRREQALQHQLARQKLTTQKRDMVKRQRLERAKLKQAHEKRFLQENTQRLNRLRKGWRGLWDVVTGQSKSTKQRNQLEVEACQARDIQEHEAMVQRHISERQPIQKHLDTLREEHQSETMALNASFVKQSQGLDIKGDLTHAFTQTQQSTQHQTLKPNLEI